MRLVFVGTPNLSVARVANLSGCAADAQVIGVHEDIPAPDMGTDGRVMGWMFDEYSKYLGFSPGIVTGR